LHVDTDQRQLALQRLEIFQGAAVAGGGEVPAAQRSRQRRATLGVGEDARDRWKGSAPQFGGDVRAFLGDDELD
jgi:hypothetical protein